MSATFPSGGQESLGGVVAISSTDVWAMGSYAPPNQTTVQTLALHWDGHTWSQVSTPNVNPNMAIDPNLFYAVAALSSTDVWAVGYFYLPNNSGFFNALLEQWNGSQWTIKPSPGVFGSELRGVAASGPTDLWAAGSFVNEHNHNPGARTLTEHTTGG